MAKNQIRPLYTWGSALTRRLSSTASSPAAQTKPPPPPPSTAAPSTKEAGGGKDWKPLYRRLSELGSAPEGSVSKTLNKWLREGRSVRAVGLMKYVKELRKYRRYKHALELMDWMEKTKGMNMSHTNHAIRLDLISKVKGIDSAEEYFAGLPEPAKNQRTYGALLNCYCSEKTGDKAIALYKKMKQLNLASSTLVHNNLMSLYMKLGQLEKVPAQFQEMKADNIVPDNLTCSLLMSCYASLNDIDSVDRVIREMEEGGEVTLQWSAYSTLAAIYSSAGLVSKAESALKKLEGLIDSRDREPFNFLISLYAGVGNSEEVNRVWKSLKSTFLKHTNLSYLTMLQALNKLDDIEGMKQLFDEWDSKQTTYDLRLANLMLSAYLRKDMGKEAESHWDRALGKGVESDFRTCELFLDFYLKNLEMDKALGWLEAAASKVKDGDWTLKKERVNAFLEGFEKSKDLAGAQRFCKTLKKLDCLDSEVYESLVEGKLGFGKGSRSERMK